MLETKEKEKQRWLQFFKKTVPVSCPVSDHKLEMLGSQTKAKNVHPFGAKKFAYSHSS